MSTRERILEATRYLIEEEGAGVAMERIAGRAGISRRAVYLHFATRTDLLLALVAHVDDAGGLAERGRRVREASSGTEALDEFVALNAAYNPEIDGVARALERARDVDEAAAAAWQDRMSGRRRMCRWIARRLDDEGSLAPGWSVEAAADLIWTLTNIPVWRDLVRDRGWSQRRYRDRIGEVLRATLVE